MVEIIALISLICLWVSVVNNEYNKKEIDKLNRINSYLNYNLKCLRENYNDSLSYNNAVIDELEEKLNDKQLVRDTKIKYRTMQLKGKLK